MNGADNNDDRGALDSPSLDSLLAYKGQLQGEAFTCQVTSRAVRRSRRVWVLAGSALCSVAVAMAIKPDRFTFFSGFHLPLHLLSDMAAALHAGGMVALLLVAALVVGASKTADSI